MAYKTLDIANELLKRAAEKTGDSLDVRFNSRTPLAFLPRRARGEAPSTERGCSPPEAAPRNIMSANRLLKAL